MYRRVGILLFSTLSFGIIAGCRQTPTDPPVQGAEVVGVIQSIRLGIPESQVLVNDTVTSSRSQGSIAGPVYVNIFAGNTEVVFRGSDGALHSGTARDLSVGDRIRATVSGTELRSAPPQYSGLRIEVVTDSVTK